MEPQYTTRPQLAEDIGASQEVSEPLYRVPLTGRPQLLADIAESQGELERELQEE